MDQDSDYSYEESDDAVASNPKAMQKQSVRGTAEASLSRTSDNSSSEEHENVSDASVSSVGRDHRQQSPPKRSAGDTTANRPFKRQRGDLNFGYLKLLNKEIGDAANRTSFGDLGHLPPGQIGLTYWSPQEKRVLFEALARLGRHDLPGIASKIGSKSMAEVSHYLNFLKEAQGRRRKLGSRSLLEPAEYPAAVELSQQCCLAQEEAADEISLKREAHEEQREQSRWGDAWDITPKVAKELGKEFQDADGGVERPPFAQLFRLSKWLELSGRMFMNSSIPSNNWNFIDPEPPSVWATTFEDFHSLAVSVTRRLVQATLFMAMSRIRSKNASGSKCRDMVLMQDAEAAIASLGMVARTSELWLKSARRLRLDVYKAPPEGGGDHDEEPMPYEEVERALYNDQASNASPQPESPFWKRELVSDGEEDSLGEGFSDASRSLDSEEREIKEEAAEVLVYSAVDMGNDKSTRRSLEAGVAMERQKERHAEACDDYASYKAEAEMWHVLQKKPPVELPKKQDPGRPTRSSLDADSIYPSERDWMRKLQYYSEWETLPEPEEVDAEE